MPRTYEISAVSALNLRFSERLALKMMTTILWPLATDERIGLLLTSLADNVALIAETDTEVDDFIDRLHVRFKQPCRRASLTVIGHRAG